MKWTQTFKQAALVVAMTITGCADQQDVTGSDDQEGTSTVQSLDARVIRGFGIAPVPLNLKGKNHALVGLGSYLVNTLGACNNCHTNPSWADGHDPFQGQPKQVNTAGYLAGGKSFGADLVSANLTPDPDTGLPAGLTYQQFRSVLQTGKDPFEDTRILQVMPWPLYQSLLEQEIQAIYEYLRAIPHACAPDPNDCYP